jgi:GT2 family glycosyltransferase
MKSILPSATGGSGPADKFRCSVIIPTYNAAALAAECLTKLIQSLSGRADVEVIVSDDGSTDSTGTVLESFGDDITVIRSERNQGFAHACNAGAKAATGRWLVFYNNDLTPTAGWIDALLDYAESTPSATVVGCKLLFPDRRVQHAGVVLCQDGYPRHVYAGFPADHPLVNRSGPAWIVTAACMLVSASWFSRLGGFDTGYRNGYEDVDFCLRVNDAGGEVHYCHRSQLTHLVSATREHRVAEFTRSEERFVEQWNHVPPNDLARYAADGLLRVNYGKTFPFGLEVAPELAVVSGTGTNEGDGAAFADLSQQVHELRRENVRLRMLLAQQGQERAEDGRPA